MGPHGAPAEPNRMRLSSIPITRAVLSCIPSIHAWHASLDNKQQRRRACCCSTASLYCQTDTLYRPVGLLDCLQMSLAGASSISAPCVLL